MTTERRTVDGPRFDGADLGAVVERLLGTAQGSYIHVGAGSPEASVSTPLYQRGWRGIVLDPDADAATALRGARPGDVVLQLAAADEERSAVMWNPAGQPADATLSPSRAGQIAAQSAQRLEARRVTTTTIAGVWAAYGSRPVDLLIVEAEGATRAVIAGAQLGILRPAAVLLDESAETWRRELVRAGLHLRASSGRWHLFGPFPPSPSRPDNMRLRVLHVLSSSNQLYSGLGRNLFELVRRQIDQFEVEFAIDGLDRRNVEILDRFCDEHRLLLHVGSGIAPSDTLDAGNANLADLLRKDRWDILEIAGWANATTNSTVLENRTQSALVFTPHYQPSWTVPMDARTERRTEEVLAAVIAEATMVCCDSLEERRHLTDLAGPETGFAVIPLGFDPERFHPGPPDRPPAVLFVGDLNEPRKRPDRTLAVFAEAQSVFPELRLHVVGNAGGHLAAQIPSEVSGAVCPLGYLDETALQAAYREAAVLLLLSDYEAFGLPVVEALASGTPVLMTDTPVNRSNFEGVRGVRFTDADDVRATAQELIAILERSSEGISEVIAARDELVGRFDWARLAQEKSRRLVAAWLRVRHGCQTHLLPRSISEPTGLSASSRPQPSDRRR